MAEEVMVTCWECDPPTEWRPAQLAGHQNRHRNEKKRAERANDSSSVPSEARFDERGETPEEAPPKDTEYIAPEVVKGNVVRPKVADGLTAYMAVLGFAISQRNAYDGTAFNNGLPFFIDSLDDVAQQNDSLYRLLEGIKKGDSPNFRLVLATLAIIVPILANHRPESKALRNLVGGLRFIPGTNVPPLPKPPDVSQEAYDTSEGMVGKMKEAFDAMSEEDRTKLEDVFTQIPPDLITRMVAHQTSPSMMNHPEATETVDGAADGD